MPTGTTVLEASAGTGKTHAIVGLAVRYVAEAGIAVSDLLLVTFSRAATQELRERTRERFVAVAAALAEPERAAAHDDELVRALAGTEPALRRQRLLAALAEFDAGTIATTHSFCQRMLDELGLAGDDDPGTRLVENVDDVVQTVADDLYLARYARTEPPFPPKAARALALAAVHDRHATLAPDQDGEGGERVAFATAVRAETERRKRLLGLRDFDDLLVVLHDVLADPVHGPGARARVRERFPVALVDEFQDTDPLQWEILRLAFHGASTLVLVGDPKQAIYAFRGAEVLSYLDAVAVADARHELTHNRRSDAGLLRALAHLQGGAALGHPAITVAGVEPTREWSRLTGPDERIVPLRLRCLPRTGAGPLGSSGFPQIGRVRERAAADLADDVVGLLESGVRLRDRAGAPRDLGPGDIAVLVRTRSQLEVVRAALDRVGVAAVLAGGTSVFGTPSATHWLWVLRALEQPHRSDRVRLAACTPLLGVDAAELDRGGAELTGRISTLLRESARLFGRAGFAAVFERLAAATELAPRLLGLRNGERELTDLRHLAQLLDQVALTDGLGLTALTRWLGDRVRDPASGSVADRSRRLDRDSAAVQIATVHASKGLEFPIVYLPFAWDSARNPKPATQLYHDGRTRVLDVGGPDIPGAAETRRRAEAEEAGEELRLLYVALTRAMCQVVAWWAPAWGTESAPLHRMTLGRPDRGPEVPARAPVPADAAALAALTAWAAPADGAIAVSAPDGAAPAEPHRLHVEPQTGPLAAATFRRALDHQWRRTSYSALTAGAHEAAAETEPENDRARPDEPVGIQVLDPAEPPAPAAPPSLMNALPYGAEFGTLVHGVLELVDTDAADLAAEVRARCRDAVHAAASAADPEVLAAALLAVLHTPLGLGRTLAEIPSPDRLSELDFELPLAGGERPATAAASLPAIAALLERHLPADDALAGYPAQLAHLDGGALRGYLTGSIDAVLRLPGPRFVVVDYKTNRLGLGDLTVAHYTPERMAAEMIRSHYPLQAVLYAVALHRFLRWRLPGYDPERHLGGVRYLFVRGMIGPETPGGAGIFAWTPPAALVTELSDLLAGQR
nr:UvrD-helicase domain-containing protein [Nocardia harenae]